MEPNPIMLFHARPYTSKQNKNGIEGTIDYGNLCGDDIFTKIRQDIALTV
jgi:hypothetical protein